MSLSLLQFTSDDILFDDEPCIPFNTHLFPYHDEDNIIQDVSQGSTLQDVLHAFANPSSQFDAGMSSTSLPGCFNQIPRLILYEKVMKHLDWLQFHLPVLYEVVGSSLQTCIYVSQ